MQVSDHSPKLGEALLTEIREDLIAAQVYAE